MARLEIWSEDKARIELDKRLSNAIQDRTPLEVNWQQNERVIFNTNGAIQSYNASVSMEDTYTGAEGVNQSASSVGINYLYKNYRYIHSQLSANPPTVIPRPTSNDPDDRRKADAADRLVRYAIKEYDMQNTVDIASNNCLLYGSGFTKTKWNPESGDPIEFDEETGDYLMEGNFDITVPNVWDIYLDPDARNWNEVNWIFERITMSWDEAKYRFPDKVNVLKKHRKQNGETNEGDGYLGGKSLLKNPHYDVVELYEYWEKGKPENGFVGRFCVCTRNGELISEMMENPEQYSPPIKQKEGVRPLPVALLPYQIFTEIDVPNMVWGKSFVEYALALQDNLNRIDNMTLECAQAHGIPRLILPESAEMAKGSITNSPWDVVKITGNMDFHFAEPMQMPSIMPDLMERYRGGINEMSGVNDSMMGEMNRETSGTTLSLASQQGNTIRRRLFNKYTFFVEAIYKSYLRIVQKNWKLTRTILVLGKEKAFESIDIKGADIDGGFDLVVEYGASLSLDPTMRREEILTLMPLFDKAGVESRTILQMLKLNELSGMHDTIQLASDRQKEIFDEMIAKGIYIAPEELQDHKHMLEFAYHYLMTTEFKYLIEDEKVLVRRHVREREELAAEGAGAAVLEGNAPGPTPEQPAGPLSGLPPLPGLGQG